MTQKSLWPSLLSALLVFAVACGDDEDARDGGALPSDASTDEGPLDASRDAYVWMPDTGGSGGNGASGGSGGTSGTGSGGGGGVDGRMCAEPRDYLPESLLPRCSADTAQCIADCAAAADPDTCREVCIDADTTPAEGSFGLNCAACIYLTLFACIDMTDCHDGVAEVFCCIEDNCPPGSPDGCSEQRCGGEIEAALTCGYFADQGCVDILGAQVGRCFAGSSDEDAGS